MIHKRVLLLADLSLVLQLLLGWSEFLHADIWLQSTGRCYGFQHSPGEKSALPCLTLCRPLTCSSFDTQVQLFSDTDIPVFFSEYGATTVRPRVFHETRAIYSSEMTHVFSGGCVYQFYQGPNRYGIVELMQNFDGTKSLHKNSDFKSLKNRLLECMNEQPVTFDVPTSEQAEAVTRPFPTTSNTWRATTELPSSPVDWEEVRSRLDLSSWVVLEDGMQRGGTVSRQNDDYNLRIQVHMDLQVGRRR